MNKDQAIEALQKADPSLDAWEYDIIQALPDYTRGYMDGRIDDWSECGLEMHGEDYKNFLIQMLTGDIWL